MERASGILLHITSLPDEYGLGCFSAHAYEFINFLNAAKIKYWQVLPFAHNNYGESPYSGFSAFAGNPYFIDLREFLTDAQLLQLGFYFRENKDYPRLQSNYDDALKLIYNNNKSKVNLKPYIEKNKFWINDYAMFMAIKQEYNAVNFSQFPLDLRLRKPSALKMFKVQNADQINFHIFCQYIFELQWQNIKNFANNLNVKILGDMPIYVSPFSSDVWANKQLFSVDDHLNPILIAGTPPDYFSQTGQLWDNPVYNYEKMKETNFEWWIQRFKHYEMFFNAIKIDHFRGFASFWAVNYGEKNAINGKWYKAPGAELFTEILNNTKLEIIAEDLGIITPDVVKLLKLTGLPGMKVLQFAFDSDDKNPYLPHNIVKPNCVAYIGTHDNDTLLGFLNTCDNEKLIKIKAYFNLPDNSTYEEIADVFINTLFTSKANLVVLTMQDILKQDGEYRMNIPGTVFGNWKYKLNKSFLTKDLEVKLKNCNENNNR